MISYFITNNNSLLAFGGILTAFIATCFMISKCSQYLPKDQGRDFAVEGKKSAGKPRGAGIVFVLVFAVTTLLFANLTTELCIYLMLVVIEMLTGFFDDTADKPWGELRKGILDLIVAAAVSFTYFYYNSSTLIVGPYTITLPPAVLLLCAIVLVWVSINVTNCADGVDGLSGTLTIITLMTIYIFSSILSQGEEFALPILIFAVCILGYLWYNATPSRLLMGDAGSRAMGVFISIAILKTGNPILYIPAAFVLIMDGGLGLVKVALIRVCKVHILKNVLTPLHDHVRKKSGWSNTQTVFRFAIIQIVISIAMVYILLI
ncbi:MAG TPA: phospho-N-acetylmuramoyl-pentapeptide-transferase [Lachnospiraceae bacterium]|nr:phospho-N-acetylmuramoyl-pentapeptide-transferase [Lachnospiraceae bacterium]